MGTLDDIADEMGIRDYQCVDCGTEYSDDGKSECPKCGSDAVNSL